MDRLDLYKELYFSELTRKADLRTALTLPIGIATVLGGVIAVYLNELGKIDVIDLANGFFLFFVVLLVLAFLLTIKHLIWSYHNWEYSYVPSAVELEKAHIAITEYYQRTGTGDQEAEEDFMSSLIDSFATAQEKNAYNNDAKSEHLHRANQTLIYCLVLVLLAAIPYFFLANQ